ncbi:MAG: hypothetical protein GTN82_05575, partial [Candidatus Aminicenantes bacterium]|nr:hypothetical protein [Candidatus Aminicenantes bacterium]
MEIEDFGKILEIFKTSIDSSSEAFNNFADIVINLAKGNFFNVLATAIDMLINA